MSKNFPKPFSLVDSDDLDKEIARTYKTMGIKDGAFVFADREYYVELDRCDTHLKLLSWVLHLNGKSWMCARRMRYFILCVCKANNLESPQKPL